MRLGIIGGTFDPIHRGHLSIASSALREMNLDRVLFLPDGLPPHKTPAASGKDRLNMVRAAIAGDARFKASNLELERKGRTYTVDTLVILKERHRDTVLFYIIGSDAFLLFSTWREPSKVAALCSMCVILRSGDSKENVKLAQEGYRKAFGLESWLLRCQGPDISSSQVRAAAIAGLPLDGLVPKEVAYYIRTKGLYGADHICSTEGELQPKTK